LGKVMGVTELIVVISSERVREGELEARAVLLLRFMVVYCQS
jgi:hypothetical protein